MLIFSANYDYDIAIVTIDGQIVFGEYVGPACLPFKFAGYDFAGSRVTAMGTFLTYLLSKLTDKSLLWQGVIKVL